MTVDQAREKARSTAAAIKEKSLAEKKEQRKSIDAQLATLSTVSTDVLDFLSINANRGIEDIPMFDSLPIMRVHTSQSTTNKLSDGGEPEVGQLYHSADQSAYDEVTVHLLCIKKCQMPEYGGQQLKAHYLVAGMIDETQSPFVMYIKGMSYNKVWELQEQLKPFVKNKKQPIPMFALKIKLYTEKEKPQDPKYAAQFVVKYQVLFENGIPLIETDLDRLQMLKDGVEKSEMVLDEIIESRGARYSDESQSINIPEPMAASTDDYEKAFESEGEDTPF